MYLCTSHPVYEKALRILYGMMVFVSVYQYMLRTYEGKYVFSKKENNICDCFWSKQMPQTDQTLHSHGLISELPSIISTIMDRIYRMSKVGIISLIHLYVFDHIPELR